MRSISRHHPTLPPCPPWYAPRQRSCVLSRECYSHPRWWWWNRPTLLPSCGPGGWHGDPTPCPGGRPGSSHIRWSWWSTASLGRLNHWERQRMKAFSDLIKSLGEPSKIIYICFIGECGVCVDNGWVKQPHLAWVKQTLGLGGDAHMFCIEQ